MPCENPLSIKILYVIARPNHLLPIQKVYMLVKTETAMNFCSEIMFRKPWRQRPFATQLVRIGEIEAKIEELDAKAVRWLTAFYNFDAYNDSHLYKCQSV